MKENWYAPLISILRGCSMENAFEAAATGRVQYSKADKKAMKRMIEFGMTYKQVGDVYGMSKDAVFKLVRRLDNPQYNQVKGR